MNEICEVGEWWVNGLYLLNITAKLPEKFKCITYVLYDNSDIESPYNGEANYGLLCGYDKLDEKEVRKYKAKLL